MKLRTQKYYSRINKDIANEQLDRKLVNYHEFINDLLDDIDIKFEYNLWLKKSKGYFQKNCSFAYLFIINIIDKSSKAVFLLYYFLFLSLMKTDDANEMISGRKVPLEEMAIDSLNYIDGERDYLEWKHRKSRGIIGGLEIIFD